MLQQNYATTKFLKREIYGIGFNSVLGRNAVRSKSTNNQQSNLPVIIRTVAAYF